MMTDRPVVFVVDDDAAVRKALSVLLDSHGYLVETFPSAEAFLSREPFHGIGCLLLDVKMDGTSGLELQQVLIQRASMLPIIFISGQATISMSVQALRSGAITFLEKTCGEEELILAINEALASAKRLIKANKSKAKAKALLQRLSPREMEVYQLILKGILNKQIAAELQIAEQTVKLHRHSIYSKLGVHSVPELISIALVAGMAKADF